MCVTNEYLMLKTWNNKYFKYFNVCIKYFIFTHNQCFFLFSILDYHTRHQNQASSPQNDISKFRPSDGMKTPCSLNAP